MLHGIFLDECGDTNGGNSWIVLYCINSGALAFVAYADGGTLVSPEEIANEPAGRKGARDRFLQTTPARQKGGK